MTIRKQKTREAIELITEAIKATKMENMGLANPTKYPDETVTEYVKRVTRLYRESWMLTPLEIAVEILTKELER